MTRPRDTVDMTIQPQDLAQHRTGAASKRKGGKGVERIVEEMGREMGPTRPRADGQRWTDPTPTSLRREAQELDQARAEQDARTAHQEAQRPAPDMATPRPALARPLEDVQAPAVGSPSSPRPAPGTRKRSERGAHMAADRLGEPCACGTTPDEVCLAHSKLLGHRRHVRPGR